MIALIAFVCGLIAIPIEGFAVSRLWNWFVAPQFDLPTLNAAHGFGIALLVALVAHQHVPRDDEANVEMAFYSLAAPVLGLALGWAVNAWWL